jgi:hypothetical protein
MGSISSGFAEVLTCILCDRRKHAKSAREISGAPFSGYTFRLYLSPEHVIRLCKTNLGSGLTSKSMPHECMSFAVLNMINARLLIAGFGQRCNRN